jgi:uncharacterized protein (TIGR02599 family)
MKIRAQSSLLVLQPSHFQNAFKMGSRSGFSILELLCATVVLLVILSIIFGMTRQLSTVWKGTRSKIETFQNARAAFEVLTQNLAQATLNVYYDYYDSAGNRWTSANSSMETTTPYTYGRYSDLHFISGKSLVDGQVGHSVFFQVASSYSETSDYQYLNGLLNATGYYVSYVKDRNIPAFLSSISNSPEPRYRFRLMQFMQATENFTVYSSGSDTAWFTTSLAQSSAPVRAIADNIIVLVLNPKDANENDLTGDTFEYNSRSGMNTIPQLATTHQLPALIEVVMVAIDEASAGRLCSDASPSACFGLGSLFKNPSRVESDLATLEKTLLQLHVNYHVFRTMLALRSSKWSS